MGPLGLFAVLGERLILRILRKVPVRELLRLMESSKSMYIFANYNKIWCVFWCLQCE
jgi:hypothetical protein